MPIPVSVIVNSSVLSMMAISRDTHPSLVNLIALEQRLMRICFKRKPSTSIIKGLGK